LSRTSFRAILNKNVTFFSQPAINQSLTLLKPF
jgi:hypothetical protein